VRVHLFATEPQYERHVRAVWKHLPAEMRGEEFLGRAAAVRGMPAKDYVMVGGFTEIDRVQRHRLIYVEHGAGQSYKDIGPLSEAYSHKDSKHPQRVMAYICPRQIIAEAWGRPAFAAGCPALDEVTRVPWPQTAVITFHWDARQVCPEARSARPHWIDNLHEVVAWLRDYNFDVVGSGHPKDREAEMVWNALNVPFWADPDTVLARACLLIADNTSLMYEAAALDIPVLVLNAPWFRRNVDHGLRFWEHVPGRQFDHIDELLLFDVREYVEGSPYFGVARPFADQRAAATVAAYDGPPDGKSGQRAAEWLVRLIAPK